MTFDKMDRYVYRPLVEGDRHAPLSISELEEAIGCSVPRDYAEFLRRFPDTGIFEAEGVVFIESDDRLSGQHDGRYAVETLFAACSDKRYDLLEIRREDQRFDSVLNYCLRIGDDSFGNFFYLDLREKTFGRVYFWDHEHAAHEAGLHVVAPDFASFVDSLELDDN